MQGKEKSGQRDQGEFDKHALLHHQAILHILLISPHYNHPPSSPPHPPLSPPPSGGLDGLQGPPPPLHGLLLPLGSKTMTGITQL